MESRCVYSYAEKGLNGSDKTVRESTHSHCTSQPPSLKQVWSIALLAALQNCIGLHCANTLSSIMAAILPIVKVLTDGYPVSKLNVELKWSSVVQVTQVHLPNLWTFISVSEWIGLWRITDHYIDVFGSLSSFYDSWSPPWLSSKLTPLSFVFSAHLEGFGEAFWSSSFL